MPSESECYYASSSKWFSKVPYHRKKRLPSNDLSPKNWSKLKVSIWASTIEKGGKDYAKKTLHTRTDHKLLEGGRSAHEPGKYHRSSCKTSGYYGADLLPLEERIRRNEDQPGQKAKGAGKGKYPA